LQQFIEFSYSGSSKMLIAIIDSSSPDVGVVDNEGDNVDDDHVHSEDSAPRTMSPTKTPINAVDACEAGKRILPSLTTFGHASHP
jgi:hypothetical protein